MPRSTTRAARASSRRDEYDEDQEVRQGGRASRYDDDEDEPRRPSSRSRSRDEDDDRSSRRPTTRSRSRDEGSDDRDSRRASRAEGAKESGRSTVIGRGRESLRKHSEERASSGGSFPERLAVDKDEEVVVKFLDDDFFITFYQHEFFKEFEHEKRQKTFICLGDDCPLCAVCGEGHARFYSLINVLDLRKPSKPALKVWFATPDPGGKIADEMDALAGKKKPRSINDPDLYYVVSKKKAANGFFTYSIKPVRDLDELEDEYEIEAFDADELADFEGKRWDGEFLRINTRRDLLEIADELSDED